ncbi:hypothetical protein GGD63_005830 [Bradyrhizobium sp. cir1]|nr:hypothetical protein [Bradyrhizobium sp. cir1]
MSGAQQRRSRLFVADVPAAKGSNPVLPGLGRSTLLFACEDSDPVRQTPQMGIGPYRPLLYTHRPHWYHRLTDGSKQRAGPICRASSSATSQWYNVTPRAIQGLLAHPHKIQAADLSQAAEETASGRRACRILFLNGPVRVSAQGTLHVIFCVMQDSCVLRGGDSLLLAESAVSSFRSLSRSRSYGITKA